MNVERFFKEKKQDKICSILFGIAMVVGVLGMVAFPLLYNTFCR